jgi:CBS domain containing-hemolysin-like protein
MAFLIFLLFILLVCSAFFSGTETAFFALSRYEVEQLRKDPRSSHRLVAELLRRPRKLLLGLMIGNVTINTFIFALSLALFQELPGQYAVLAPILGLISPIMVTLFGEILPKGTAIVLREKFAPMAAPLVRIFQIIVAPISFVLNHLLVEPTTRLAVGGKRPPERVSAEELRELLEMSASHRIINADENAMLSGVVRLGELHVRDVMVHRVDIIAFDLNDDPDKLRRIMRERKMPKLPVYDEDIDRIRGIIYAKQLYLNPHQPLRKLVRPVRFVPEQINLNQLLTHFRESGTQLAIVVDEYGGVVGLVTLEDVAEEIVGELTFPGEEEERPSWEMLDENVYRVAGDVSIRDWAEQFDVRSLDERITTLAGLFIERLERLPVIGDQVQLGNLLMTVESLQGRRIEWIRLELLENGEAEAASVADEEQG